MAHSDPISEEALNVIAQRVSECPTPAGLAGFAKGKHLELGTTLSVWMLGLAATTERHNRLETVATRTSLWHHQLWHAGTATKFARSRPFGHQAEDWKVQAVTTSKIAEKIEHALAWVDKHVAGDPLVRLLIIPAYYLHALWLVTADSDQILIADRPKQYATLELDHLYSFSEFLAHLSLNRPREVFPKFDPRMALQDRFSTSLIMQAERRAQSANGFGNTAEH
jgi:hypothetical protein